MATTTKTLLLLAICSMVSACKEVTTVENFDQTAYASGKWFVHQQAMTRYLPKDRNYCVTAEYNVLDNPTTFGYTIGVTNKDADANGNVREGNLCAFTPDSSTPSKLAVAVSLSLLFLVHLDVHKLHYLIASRITAMLPTKISIWAILGGRIR